MGNKIRPDSFRLGVVLPWQARWFSKKSFRNNLEEDTLVRKVVMDKIATAGVVNINIERNVGDLKVIIKAARPGLVIGRGGKGIEELSKVLKVQLRKLYKKRGKSPHLDARQVDKPPTINLTIDELKRTEISAANIAQNIAWDLEKRRPYRRVMKKHLEAMIQNREVKGAKVKLAGRLNGAEIARQEWLSRGRLPLHTIRANIDYGTTTARTTHGSVGIKVWIYKGDVFNE